MSNQTNEYSAVFYEAFEEEQLALKKYLPAELNCLFTWETIQESGHKLPPSKVISTRTQSIFPVDWIDHLDAIITRSTGYDHVVDYFKTTNSRIDAAYLPDYARRAVAEQAMILWSSLLRSLKSQQMCFKTFHRDGLTGREIAQKTIAVLGVGRIGTQIVDVATGLKMKVIGVDIKPNQELAGEYNFDYLPLDQALAQADIAVCSMNLTDDNIALLDYQRLKQMPGNAIFVNIARGEISPAEDLLRLLDENCLAGVGLDVYDHEKELASFLRGGAQIDSFPETIQKNLKAIKALMEHPQAILTPHNAFNTEESVERKSLHTAQNLEAYFKTGSFLTPVP